MYIFFTFIAIFIVTIDENCYDSVASWRFLAVVCGKTSYLQFTV